MDEQQFSKLYQEFFSPVYRYIARRIPDRQDAEDITQQAFLKLFNSSLNLTQPDNKPLAYLYIIARHLVADYWSARGRHDISLDDTPEPPDENISETRQQNKIDIAQALSVLAPNHRLIIELKFRDGLTTQEIALRLMKNEEAVRQIQCRALKELREIIFPTL